eukprot:CAMPEP_0184660602 /NCGR_PEP_ID=MMETSP0308-20130426/34410_1 /TAXON_ID=38269 /ORGANISM="Gloeochaete witrockiana, Strain SAG 46.84" /LENGTH=205 /DNA_ID=CAMNT_0027101289 /DNA_START=77 /DNA_END=691 /DNA_ORIENTATION=-
MDMQISKLNAVHVPDAIRLLTEAFADDPWMSYFCPDKIKRSTSLLPALFGNLVPVMVKAGHVLGVFCTDEKGTKVLAAVAIWTPPGAKDPAQESLFSFALDMVKAAGLKALFRFIKDVQRILPYKAKLTNDEPHWYLAVLGCDSKFRGQGFGSRLIELVTKFADATGRICYLENSNPKNLGLYTRNGFKVEKVVEPVAKDGASIW